MKVRNILAGVRWKSESTYCLKSEFHKSLIVHLRSLRKVDLDKRKQLYGSDVAEEDYSDDDDDDEYQNVRVSKRRRITA